ncbi:unnamed protein product [Cylicocyclus nassatus]|uniref:guanylate cyclase n=1 Tax=Cylicocyclus nassatus TaxID=53992 RepID=A0AA36MHX7_CYLNA|nr:unnamed protein product [Cylicocyclus nassatus]
MVFLAITGQLSDAVDIKISVLSDPDHTFAQSVLEAARRDIKASAIAPEFTFEFLEDNSKCTPGIDSLSSLAVLTQDYYKDNTQAVFGPSCYNDVPQVAGLTAEFDILQFNPWADHTMDYEVNNIVQMITRSTFNIAENILALLKAADWNKIAVVTCLDCYYGLSDAEARGYRQYNVTSYLADRGITILGNLEMSKYWNASFLADSVDNLSKICRVILPLLGNQLSDYVLFLEAMNTTGHLTPEYSILIVFWDYQAGFMQTLELYETLFVYANILHSQYQTDTSGYYNATTLRKLITSIQGPFGEIRFNENTQRIAPFTFGYISDSGYSFISKLEGVTGCKQTPCLTLNLANTNLKMREDMPTCGFKGELCDQTGTIFVIFIVMAAVALCIGLFVSLRKIKHIESMQMPWAIPYPSLKFIDLDISTHGSQQLSILSLNEHMETKVKMRDFLRTRQLATINQSYVLVETISLKERLVFFKQDVDLLLKIKHSNHENINPFIGLSYDSAHLYVLWTHCFRGSLAEQIFGKKDERATFENNFRGAFVRDILKGLDYIHNSSIGYHGALTTGHCLIDSHWILKISGFGLSRMLFRMKNAGVIGTEDGRPLIPNADLHYIAPEIRTELRSHSYPNKSDNLNLTNVIGKAGDMWSFGTILSEILFRRKYVDLEDYYDSGEDELICEKADDTLRANPPSIPEDREIHADLRALIQKCWEGANTRPDVTQARKITDATLKMSGSLVDQMIKNMEEYTNGLEELVKRRTGLLEEAQKKSDELLSELLPKSVAEELKVGRRVDAKNYKSASILYSDIVGFTSLCSESEPMEVVALLSGMFQKFDHIISVHNGYKMETIGDAYCVASGVPNPSKTEHVSNIATIALLQREFLYDFMIPHRPGQYLHCRWGFNTGPVFTGVVGIRAPRYSVFGPTVTIAAKMENSGIPDKIQMTLKSHQMLSARFPEFKCSSRGSVKIDGIGTLLTYWLDGVEDLLKSDRTPRDKEPPPTNNTSDEDTDPYSFPRESSQISSANSVVPLIP